MYTIRKPNYYNGVKENCLTATIFVCCKICLKTENIAAYGHTT